MHWLSDEPLICPQQFAGLATDQAEVTIAMLPVGDYAHTLTAGEQAGIGRAVHRRKQQYASGRLAAKQAAQHTLDRHLTDPPTGKLTRVEVIADKDRCPLWPDGLVGSISHTESWAVAIAAAQSGYRGIGIDIEESHRVTPEIAERVFSSAERTRHTEIQQQGRVPVHQVSAAAFCAKEAGYKAIYPTGRQFIGFLDAEIDLQWHATPNHVMPNEIAVLGQFSIRYLGYHAANQALETGVGYFYSSQTQTLAVFFIPQDDG